MKRIAVARREVKTWSDWTAFNLVRFLRWSTDLATGYRHQKEVKKLETDPRAQRFVMTEQKWLTRFVFLESIAGVPGIVGGMLRHLRSLRRMQRDNGWFVTLALTVAAFSPLTPLSTVGSKVFWKKPTMNACTYSPS